MVQTINTECSGGTRPVDRMAKLLYLLDTSLVGQRPKGHALWWYNGMMQTCNRTDIAYLCFVCLHRPFIIAKFCINNERTAHHHNLNIYKTKQCLSCELGTGLKERIKSEMRS